VVGNPGRQAGWMSERGFLLQFDTSGIAICADGEEYIFKEGIVTKKK
jgi:hypothetical protein